MDEFDAAVAAPRQGFTDIEAARLIGRVLFNAARTLGVEYDRNTRLQVLCERSGRPDEAKRYAELAHHNWAKADAGRLDALLTTMREGRYGAAQSLEQGP